MDGTEIIQLDYVCSNALYSPYYLLIILQILVLNIVLQVKTFLLIILPESVFLIVVLDCLHKFSQEHVSKHVLKIYLHMQILQLMPANQLVPPHTMQVTLQNNVYSSVQMSLLKLMHTSINVLIDVLKIIMVKTVQEHVALIAQIYQISLLTIQQIFVLQHVLKDYFLKTQLINAFHNVLSDLMLIQQQEYVWRNALGHKDFLLIQVTKDVLANAH